MAGMPLDDAKQNLSQHDLAVRALAFELKNPLINIARRAELADPAAYEDIQATAEQALILIDSHLLNARSEYGQIMLDMSPVTVGSVLYDASHLLRNQASTKNRFVSIDDRTDGPVMTNRPALLAILSSFGNALAGHNPTDELSELTLRGYKTRAGKLGIGMFTKVKLTQQDLRRALELQGRAHMPLSMISGKSNASLVIADGLCRAIGGAMTVKHMGRLSGLATELPRSEQLSFV